MSDAHVLLGQYINSVACVGLMGMIYSIAWVSSRKHNTGASIAMCVVVVPLGIQVLTPFLPDLLPPIAWSGVILHCSLFIVCGTACRRELWALVRLKTHAAPPGEHPMRRPEDFTERSLRPINSKPEPIR